ncbi:MAG TPA: hypothetical protein VJN62_14925 [Gemmatimonadales bacterium]|nr:hypothetical protein [Gemmatimonadales bacterium]
MLPETVFRIQLVLGYVAMLLLFTAYVLPRLRALGPLAAQRAIATLHSFRFFGLVFILPGVVGAGLPAPFSTVAAYGDLATGVLALTALAAFRNRPLFLALVGAYNVVGVADLLLDYAHAIQFQVPELAGQLGAMYWVPVLYVPLLMITHVAALYWLVRPHPAPAPAR